jgi:signal transduction histidine kinase/CheY-like chemotaxis protein/HPt (histidine-containing phosphotransfer) domain-containing protein
MVLKNASIPTKMVLLACSSAGLALLMACVGFAWHGVKTLRDAKGRQLRDQAQIIAFHAGPAIALRDRQRGEKLLASLQSEETLEEGRLYGNERNIIAQWGEQRSFTAPSDNPNGYRFIGFSHVEVFHPVVVGSQQLGSVYLRANTKDLEAQLMEFAQIAATLLAIAMLVVIVISMRLQRAVSRPILALTEAAEHIAVDGDYSIRVEGTAGAELKRLQDTFNSMVNHVERSEKAIQAAQNDLEERVVARTQELSLEVARRREVQADLEAAKETAESANNAKTEFLANMSHEIRTPLNGIMGFTELLLCSREEITPQEQHEHLTTIHKSGSHLVELINDILDVSKIEAGHFEVERITCSPHQIISDVVSVLRMRAKEKHLYLDYQPESPMPEAIESDPARLRQLVMNLVSNAIKFTEVGGIRITASLTKAVPQQLQIEVVDSGIGIPFAKLEQIFDPFNQADTSVTRRFGGTGLGLAISRKITEALGGRLTVESDVGAGSVFTATIDVGQLSNISLVDSPRAATSLAAATVEPPAPAGIPPARILVVDDGETNRKLIRLILARAGAEVLCAENGLEAVHTVETESPDLVLMDMQMPVMDGYSATRELRAKGCAVPIVALTAHAMKGDEQKCFSAGCTGYLAKPVDSTEMLRLIANILTSANQRIPAQQYPLSSHQTRTEPRKLHSALPMEDLEFRDIVAEFVERLHGRLAEMRNACAAGSFEELASSAHWLKGAGGTAGFDALTEPSKALESAARAGDARICESCLQILADLTSRIEVPGLDATSTR